MKQNAYSMFDSKTKLYTKPSYFHNHPAAIRAITDEVNNPEASLSQHSEDYTLFYIGQFDDESGLLTPDPQPLPICKCWELEIPQ